MEEVELQVVALPRAKSAEVLPDDIVIGHDVLELVTAAMYVDPLSIYREYIQNAADSIDDARELGLFQEDEAPKIEIAIDVESRTVRIRDNGASIAPAEFARRLLAIGASPKRGTPRRGFRGIGRLAGLGYCQELVFRARAENERSVFELSWDARKLKQILRGESPPRGDLVTAIQAITRVTKLSGDSWPRRFFDVELRKVVRIKRDVLLNHDAVEHYLAQVAPVPFRTDLEFADRINAFLRSHGVREPVAISVNGRPLIERPHPPSFDITPKVRDTFTNVNFLEIPGIDGGMDAVAWCLDHGYHGSIPRSLGIGGLRLRSGNMQVGESDIVAELFVEPRFNGWAVGEFHVLTQKVVPNGRRDNFEYNVHLANVQAHITRLASELTRTCRTRSDNRRRLRNLSERIAKLEGDLSLVRRIPDALPFRLRHLDALATSASKCDSTIDRAGVPEALRDSFRQRLDAISKRIEQTRKGNGNARFFERLPPVKRRAYADVLSAIYETLGDLELAHETVLKLMKRIGAGRRKVA
jgi:molecular chaperone HtpG